MSSSPDIRGGLFTTHISSGSHPRCVVIMLHGYAMRPDDLAPFGQSLGIDAEFYIPAGPLSAGAGLAWWPIDEERRAQAVAIGPRDLSEEHPAGLQGARVRLGQLVSDIRGRHAALPLVLLGFSQGGMLACDAVLRGAIRPDALVLLSASRLGADEWLPRSASLAGLPMLISHGDRDEDLSFRAGEALRDFCLTAGARVTWVPFAGRHEIPLVVWRQVRRFLNGIQGKPNRQDL